MTRSFDGKGQPGRCQGGKHDTAIETMDGHKRCVYCGFPMNAETAVADVNEQLRRIGIMPPENDR